MILGSTVELGQFGPELITGEYLGWFKEKSFMLSSRQRLTSHTHDTALDYLRSFENTPNKFWAIYRRTDRLHVGTMTAYVDRTAGSADIGILVGNAEARGKGFGREAWGRAKDYPFRVEGGGEVTGGTPGRNQAKGRGVR